MDVLAKLSPEQIHAISEENLRFILENTTNKFKDDTNNMKLMFKNIELKNGKYVLRDIKFYDAFQHSMMNYLGKTFYMECFYKEISHNDKSVFVVYPLDILSEDEATQKYNFPEKLVENNINTITKKYGDIWDNNEIKNISAENICRVFPNIKILDPLMTDYVQFFKKENMISETLFKSC